MRGGRIKVIKTAFHSISWKLSVGVALPTLAAMIFSLSYFTVSSRNNSVKQYERQTEAVFQTSMKNIDYYLSSCISSSKSVYVNDALLTFFRQSNKSYTTSKEREMIFSYLKTVYYSISKARQIYLAIPNMETSFLYITDSLWTSTASLRISEDQFPRFYTPRDVVVEPTHRMEAYGHVVRAGGVPSTQTDDLVFTIWLPVCDLPYSNTVAAYLAIDMPMEFIMENCQLAYDETETVYITDEDGIVIASSDEETIHQDIREIYPIMGKLDSSKFDSMTDDGLLLMQAPMESDYTDWNIVKAVPVDNLFGGTWGQEKVLMLTMLTILVLILVINICQILYYMIPIKQVTSYMSLIVKSRSWKKDIRLSDYVTYKANDEIGILIETFGTMMESINNYTIREFELELAYIKSAMKMFQAQINPHFIYNTIQYFATNALKKEDLEQYHHISSFGQMLHYAMILEPALVPFSKETNYVKRYIELQKMRFGSTGQVLISVSEDADRVMVPRMILQPVVENSFTHGRIFHDPHSILRISAEVEDKTMRVCVEDNGIPISQEDVKAIIRKLSCIEAICVKPGQRLPIIPGETPPKAGGGEGIGLENVYTRLLLSHRTCDFTICANEMGGTTTTICFPVQVEYHTILADEKRGEINEGTDRR